MSLYNLYLYIRTLTYGNTEVRISFQQVEYSITKLVGEEILGGLNQLR